jgi:ribosomal protein L11 methyltransferase
MNWIQMTIFTSENGIEVISNVLIINDIEQFTVESPNDFKEFLKSNTPNWDYVDEKLMSKLTDEPCIKVCVPNNLQGIEQTKIIRNEIERLKHLASIGELSDLGRLEIDYQDLFEEDWADNWKQYFKPFKLGDRVVIKPHWEEYDADENDVILEIDPGMAFGTGTHQSTQMCVEALQNYIKSGDKVIDLGCGSGILSICALLLGAKIAVATDIDENAVRITIENAKMNNIYEDRITAIWGNALADEKIYNKIKDVYDLVLANIVADVIIPYCPMVHEMLKPKGIFITSGIINHRTDDVKNAILNNGFVILEHRVKDDWSAFVCQKQ